MLSDVVHPSDAEPAIDRVVDVYADISCPFAYVGLRRLIAEREARSSDVVFRIRAWPLEWVNGRPHDPQHAAEVIAALRAQVSPDLFTGFDPKRFPTTTIPALGLAATAYRHGVSVGEQLSMRLRVALFEEGRALADEGELRVIGREFGVDLPTRLAAEAAVRADWERGRARNVRGSPHFFAGTRDQFCPSLRIRHDQEGFDIGVDPVGVDALYALIFD